MSDINSIQNNLLKDFAVFENDREELIYYLIDLGKKLPPLEEKYKIEKYIIPGCISKVWLLAEKKGNRLFLRADSNTLITKGLISILIRIYSNQNMKDIVKSKLFLFKSIGIDHLLSIQRLHGLQNMIKTIQQIALIGI